jgi:sn-glycerol 3-phosphate transport system permease protein
VSEPSAVRLPAAPDAATGGPAGGAVPRRTAAAGAAGSGPLARRLGEYAVALLFLAPSLAVFGFFVFWPLVRSVVLSVHTQDIVGRPTLFVGLDNFRELFGSSAFVDVLVTTGLYTLLTVLPGTALATCLALLLNNRLRGMRFFRTAFAMPFAYSVATASVVFSALYNPAAGILNYVLSLFGVDGVGWLTDPGVALVSIAITTVWMSLGYNLLVLLAGVGGIPDELYEAARLDGAGGWRLVRSITLPLLTPSLFFLVVVNTIQSLQSFGQIYILTRGGPSGSTTTLVYTIFDHAFANNNNDFGLASAQALVLLVTVLVVTGVQFGVLERKVFYR